MNHLNHFHSRFKKIAFVRQMWKKRDESVRKHGKMLIKKTNSGILYLIHKAVYNVQKEGGCMKNVMFYMLFYSNLG
ncbi:hypothetical protein DWW65_09085 [Coprococcus comes]|uniref:Uncharacterized protein n=1 Tax=Coprococcus comes TaxID=410072 RepID=A0A3R5XEL5_9FIRM|nr:hypothetical protein DWW65_09085 [Coprococcus comes]